jgi:hypothetical protein
MSRNIIFVGIVTVAVESPGKGKKGGRGCGKSASPGNVREVCHITWLHIPEYSILHYQHCDNLKSRTFAL